MCRTPWIMGFDLYPMDTLAAKKAFVQEAVEREIAGVLRARSGDRRRLHPRADGKRASNRLELCIDQLST